MTAGVAYGRDTQMFLLDPIMVLVPCSPIGIILPVGHDFVIN